MKFSTLTIILFLFSCSTSGDGDPLVIQSIDKRGTDGNNAEFCSDFILTLEQVKWFFNKARKVSVQEIHDEYDYLPCYIKGTAKTNGQMCEWEIRAGGTGSLSCENRYSYYACDDCDSIFAGESSH